MTAPKSFLDFAVAAGEQRAAAKSRAAGRAQRVGAAFERDLVAAFDAARLRGRGLVVKSNPAVHVTKQRGMVFAASVGVDFIGSLVPLGRDKPLPVYFDAKTTHDRTFSVLKGAPKSDAKERARRLKQAEFIVDARRLTPLAGFLLAIHGRTETIVVVVNDPQKLALLARGESIELRGRREDVAEDAFHRYGFPAMRLPTLPPFARSVVPEWPFGVLPIVDLLTCAL